MEVLLACRRFGLVERFDAFIGAAEKTEARGDADPGLAMFRLGPGVRLRLAIGRDRFLRPPEPGKKLRPLAGKRKTILIGQRQAAFRKAQRALVAKRIGFRLRRGQIRRWCVRVAGAVEMLGVQNQIAVLEPVGGAAVQRRFGRRQKRRVGPVADQRVGEQHLRSGRANQIVRDELVAFEGGIVDEVAKCIDRKALADDGCSLQGMAVGRLQPIHAGEDQALNRSRDTRPPIDFGIVDQLLQEQRIALGPIDHRTAQMGARRDEGVGHLQRFRLLQRAEVDGH